MRRARPTYGDWSRYAHCNVTVIPARRRTPWLSRLIAFAALALVAACVAARLS